MFPPAVERWRKKAELHVLGTISVDLILAIIYQESSGNPKAFRYEARYVYFFDHAPLFDKTLTVEQNRKAAREKLGEAEFYFQSSSTGLMQLMGAAARERGFKGAGEALFDPDNNLRFGIRHLWEYAHRRGKYATEEALGRWNRRPGYATEVLNKLYQAGGAT